MPYDETNAKGLPIPFVFIGSLFIVGRVVAQNHDVTCQLGFVFEISESKSWGYKEPVIVDVIPGSPGRTGWLEAK